MDAFDLKMIKVAELIYSNAKFFDVPDISYSYDGESLRIVYGDIRNPNGYINVPIILEDNEVDGFCAAVDILVMYMEYKENA